MAYLTFNSISSKTFSKAEVLNESIRSRSYNEKIVFLSYRREDRQWVEGIVRFLKGIGVTIYIDYLDETLEDATNESVAQKLRDRIKGSVKFITLATPNSSKSKWMPWELGLGDRIINYPNVAILPLSENPNIWPDQEYGKIYGRVEKITNPGAFNGEDWYIIYPGGEKKKFKDWLIA